MNKEKIQLLSSIKVALYIASVPFMVMLFSYLTNLDFSFLGILSRHESGLKGIIFAPLVHSGWEHLFSNLPPLMFSVFLIHLFYRKYFKGIFIANYLLTGILVWTFSREVYHIGASGVVYALVSYIFWSGIFVRNINSIVLSLLVLMLYSGMFAGILPSPEILEKNISWESHLLGGVAGVFVAWTYRKKIISESKKHAFKPSYQVNESREPYFSNDIFDKTKWERAQDEQNQSPWS